MREILFRGKSVEDNEWIIGYYANETANDYDFPSIVPLKENKDQHISYAVFKDTVGQYTGLKDKNGKKIFEGDIVLTCLGRDTEKAVVFYDDRVSSFGISYIERAKTIEQINFFLDFVISAKQDNRIFVEVIGSIFDNPKLLESEE